MPLNAIYRASRERSESVVCGYVVNSSSCPSYPSVCSLWVCGQLEELSIISIRSSCPPNCAGFRPIDHKKGKKTPFKNRYLKGGVAHPRVCRVAHPRVCRSRVQLSAISTVSKPWKLPWFFKRHKRIERETQQPRGLQPNILLERSR